MSCHGELLISLDYGLDFEVCVKQVSRRLADQNDAVE